MCVDLGVRDFAHTPAQSVADEQALIDHGLALEILVTRESDGFANPLPRALIRDAVLLTATPFLRSADHGLGLVAELHGEPAMRGHYFSRRMDFLAVAGRVRGNFRGFASGSARALKIRTNLLAARTRCVEILLGVALDLRCSAA